MLFCDGGDLYTKIKEQNGKFLEESQIVEWFVQIAMALQVNITFKELHMNTRINFNQLKSICTIKIFCIEI